MYGREAERRLLDRLLDRVRDGGAASLVVRGEPGIGKTTLLDHLAGAAADLRILRVTGVETEAELPYAALHLLLYPVLDRLDALPEAQRAALRAALGVEAATGANRFQVGLAVLGLLAELSAERPVLCLVDDAQWLDRESADALVFAVRRLHAEPVGVVVAARDGDGFRTMPDLDEIHLAGLSRDAAERLLAEQSLAVNVQDQIIGEARGNPLALVELPRALSPEQRAGAFTPPVLAFAESGTPPSRVLRGFRSEVEALPSAARLCLLAAALAGTADRDVIIGAATACGAGLAALAVAERAGLLRADASGITLRHPLVRVAVQAASDIGEHTAVHRALAEATEGARRVWHLSAAATGADDALAGDLDQVAGQAMDRGAPSVAASAAERAAELTTEPGDRFRRLSYAATAALEAGQLDRAARLTRRAESGGPGRPGAMPAADRRLAGVRALIEYERGMPGRAAAILVEEAVPATAADPDNRDSVLVRAAVYTWHAGAGHGDLFRRLERHAEGSGVAGLVRGLRLVSLGEPAAAVPELARYLGTVDETMPFPQRLAAAYAASLTGDHGLVGELAEGLVAECYREGRTTLLPQPLGLLGTAHMLLGRPGEAFASIREGLSVAADSGQEHRRGHLAGVLSWLHAIAGEEERARAMAVEADAASADGRRAAARGWAVHALTELDLQRGRYEAALARLREAGAGRAAHTISVQMHAVPALVEAAVRHGVPGEAGPALARLTAWAEACARPWALAVAARCAALLADDPEPLYRKALADHDRDGHSLEHARTHLLYGEWLRRRLRRAEARGQLTAAHDLFDRLGATGWAARAADELRAAGYAPAVRDGAHDPLAVLTPQELQVVRLAATGASNRDVAARLFLSPRTVAYHLYKAFPKLGITSRAELAPMLNRPPGTAV
ncbi:helix-turn-helix transcriptional regulator [Nonomuraea rhodomycinica]|uniref:Helix-turn-helix domain-containing protein n=1 Tax=Nonomuraea rhodomycinica TaxID=1712872 RepID=A0A7Y6IN20_9ACTN|nr:LuxR family transcriptional regulator [Nonomuraea rhodomycinica]NUW41272.1 helix-turn-helix domain-containing protein [Nonomuraea rhodomycinica]